jgi:hypothetical protein
VQDDVLLGAAPRIRPEPTFQLLIAPRTDASELLKAQPHIVTLMFGQSTAGQTATPLCDVGHRSVGPRLRLHQEIVELKVWKIHHRVFDASCTLRLHFAMLDTGLWVPRLHFAMLDIGLWVQGCVFDTQEKSRLHK